MKIPILWYWGTLIIAIAANVVANTTLKMAMVSISPDSKKGILAQLFSQFSFWVGVTSAGVLLASYLVAIKYIPVSIAYVVVTTLAMIGLVIVDNQLYDSPLGVTKIGGMTLVIVGVYLMAKGSL